MSVMPMATWHENTEPGLHPDPQQPDRLLVSGDWTFRQAQRLLDLIAGSGKNVQTLDARAITRLDASGSQLLLSLMTRLGLPATALAAKPEHAALIEAVRNSGASLPPSPPAEKLLYRILEAVGRWVANAYANILIFLDFLGRTLLSLMESLFNPRHWRVTSIIFHMQAVGLNAVPLVMLLSFMVGAVVAFLGATVLSEFGAQLWVVELVGVAFFREFGVLLATMAGLLGGMAVCVWHLDISPEMFIGRLQNELSPRHFWVGMSKAPIFAMVIGLIGCLEGFKVKNNAQSVGEHTTSSVVQSISLVILLDALAAMFFMELDL